MPIQSAIAHYLSKAAHSPNCDLGLSDHLLPVDDRLTELVAEVRRLYNKRGRGYGQFTPGATFEDQVRPLLDGSDTLQNVSIAAMRRLNDLMSGVPLATGGYFLFVDYTEQDKRYLFVVSLKVRRGLLFDENYFLSDQPHLDLDALHEAARLDMTGWQKNTSNYLSFAKQRANDDMARYFVEFIGCSEVLDARSQSQALAKALIRFARETPSITEEREQEFTQNAYEYLERLADEERGVEFDSLANALHPDEPERLIQFLNDTEQISEGLQLVKEELRKRLSRIQFTLRSGRVRFSCHRAELNRSVRYDAEERVLTITEVPPDAID